MPIPYLPPAEVPRHTLPAGYRLSPITADLGDIPWGRVDEHRVEWHLVKFDGWWSSPDATGTTTEKPYGHGVWTGPAFWTQRIVTIGGLIVAPTEEARDAALDRLSVACPLTPTGLLRADSHPSTQAVVRRSGQYLVAKPSRLTAEAQVQLLAPDPLRYSTELTTVQLPNPILGTISPPFDPPVVLNESNAPTRVVFNAGTTEAPWQAKIFGQVASPRLSNLTTGAVVGFDVDIPQGAVLTLDSGTGKAMLGGTDVSGAISTGTDWWRLAKGDNTLAFSASHYAYAQFSYRSAWS